MTYLTFDVTFNVREFQEWGWGKKYRDQLPNGSQAVDIWNKKHAKELRIYHDGDPETDLVKMIQLWKKAMDKENS